MTDNQASQFNLIGVLFFVLGIALILFLAVVSQAGEQSYENSVAFGFLTEVDGTIFVDLRPQTSLQIILLRAILFGTLILILVSFVTGTCILKRVSYRISYIGAVVILLAMPLGTFLGIWTLKLLNEAESRRAFELR